MSELFGRDGRAQAGRLCYLSLGFRHRGGAACSRAHCITGVPPVFPIRAKGYNQKPESQTWAPEPFEDVEPSFHKHSYRLAPLHVVIGNAGVYLGSSVLDISAADWRMQIDVNLTGVFFLAQAAARKMVKLGRPGAILFTGSWGQEIPGPKGAE